MYVAMLPHGFRLTLPVQRSKSQTPRPREQLPRPRAINPRSALPAGQGSVAASSRTKPLASLLVLIGLSWSELLRTYN